MVTSTFGVVVFVDRRGPRAEYTAAVAAVVLAVAVRFEQVTVYDVTSTTALTTASVEECYE